MSLSKRTLPPPLNDSERVQPFRYRMATPRNHDGTTNDSNVRMSMYGSNVGRTEAARPTEESEEIRRQIDEAFQRGVGEGQSIAKVEHAAQMERLRKEIAACLQEFTKCRERYFENVERRVVELALAIARKILHRESQMDSLVLAGVARVALENISSATVAKFRVHPSQVYSWSDFFSRQAGLTPHPEIVADATMGVEQCILESDLGSVDLGLESQLVEIERWFVDLIALKP